MIRQLKNVRNTALKSQTHAMVTLKTLLVSAPQSPGEQFIAITGKMMLIRVLLVLRSRPITSTAAPAKTALRMLAHALRATLPRAPARRHANGPPSDIWKGT